MPVIGNLSVNLTTRTRKFERGMTRAIRKFQRFKRAIPGVNLVTSKFAAILSGVTVAGLVAYTKKAANAIDQTKKFGDRIGISVEELQKLRFANEKAGNSMQTLDLGLQRMTRRINEAAQGAGEARGAIAELGLDAEKLAAMSPDKQFRAIADAMENVAEQGSRVRLAMRLFDSEGVALVNTMRGGTKALDEQADKLAKYGVIVSEVDATKLEIANDEITDLTTMLDGAFETAAIAASEHVVAFSEALKQASIDGKTMGDALVQAMEFVSEAAGEVADTLSLLKGIGSGMKATWLWATGQKGYGKATNETLQGWQEWAWDIPSRNLRENRRRSRADLRDEARRQAAANRREPEAPKFSFDMLPGPMGLTGTEYKNIMTPIWSREKQASESFRALQDNAFTALLSDRNRRARVESDIFDLADKAGIGKFSRDELLQQYRQIWAREDNERFATAFSEINLARVAIPGVTRAKPQEVRDPQLEETNELLQQIAASRFVAVAG